MKFLLTMNMPSNNGFLIHQVIFEHDASSMAEFSNILNTDIFVHGKQFYKRQNDDGENVFIDKGFIILNTAHIGKAQEYIDYGSEDDNRHTSKQRPPIRGRGSSYY